MTRDLNWVVSVLSNCGHEALVCYGPNSYAKHRFADWIDVARFDNQADAEEAVEWIASFTARNAWAGYFGD